MKGLIKFFFSSMFVTLFSVCVVFVSSVYLDAKIFSNVAYYLYFIPLVVEFSIFGQHYSIMKNANLINSNSDSWKLDRRKLMVGVFVCALASIIFSQDLKNSFLLFFILLSFSHFRLLSSFLRVKEKLFSSIIFERSVQLIVALVFVKCMVIPESEDDIEFLLFLISTFIVLLSTKLLKNDSPYKNSSFKSRTDSLYEINMIFTIGSMLMVKSIDKLFIAHNFPEDVFSKFIILFQIYLPFPILGGVLFQYFMPKISKLGTISFKKKYILFCLAIFLSSWLIISYGCLWLYSNIYENKYSFNIEEISLVIASGLIYLLYQPLALVIVSLSNNRNLMTLNILNIFSIFSYGIFLSISVIENAIIYALVGFMVFWFAKLVSGIVVVRKINGFSWE
ncbi:hypothetical protein ACH7WF_002679 [Vibrio vulnificus]